MHAEPVGCIDALSGGWPFLARQQRGGAGLAADFPGSEKSAVCRLGACRQSGGGDYVAGPVSEVTGQESVRLPEGCADALAFGKAKDIDALLPHLWRPA